MYGVIYQPPNTDETKYTKENTFLVRIYGNNTEILIDRNEEIKNIVLLHSYGFGTELFATFNNGIAYEFSPGEQVNVTSIREDAVWRAVAKKMGELHRDVRKDDQAHVEAFCWTKIREFFALIPDRFSNDEIQKRSDMLIEFFFNISNVNNSRIC